MDNPYNLKRPKAIAKWLVSEAADKQYMIFDKKKRQRIYNQDRKDGKAF